MNADRVVWVSFDTIGRSSLLAAAKAGADVVGVVTLPGPPDPDRSGQCSFDEAAADVGAALVETTDINAPETVEAVRALTPDLIFIVGWSQLVREPFLGASRHGTFGMHPTLLPKHRGRAPIPWAILSGLTSTGVTLFEIVDRSADSGPIVGQVEVPIAADETATTLFEKIHRAHVDLIERCVPLLVAGDAPRVEQDERRATSWPKRTPADGLIDWDTRASHLDDWVRALTRPYPGAFTYAGDRTVVVWRARPAAVDAPAPPGTIVGGTPEGVLVACGEGGLLLEEVEIAPTGPLSGEPIVRHLPVGARLG